MFTKTVASIMKDFNKKITELDNLVSTHNKEISSNNDEIANLKADTLDRTKEVTLANNVKAKLQEILGA